VAEPTPEHDIIKSEIVPPLSLTQLRALALALLAVPDPGRLSRRAMKKKVLRFVEMQMQNSNDKQQHEHAIVF